jgi:hypothetical protein
LGVLGTGSWALGVVGSWELVIGRYNRQLHPIGAADMDIRHDVRF